MKKGLRYRYIFMTGTLIMLVSITLSTFLFYQNKQGFETFHTESQKTTEQYLKEQIRQRGIALVTVLAENITNPLYIMDMESLLLTLTATKSSPDILSAYVYDKNGLIVHDGEELIQSYGKAISDTLSIAAINVEGKIIAHSQKDIMSISRSIWIGDTPLGGVTLQMSLASVNEKLTALSHQEQALYDETIQNSYLLAFYTTLILLVIGISIAFYLSRRIVKPIEEVALAASKIGEYDFSNRLNYSGDDEIGKLVNSFNGMSNKLKEERACREETEAQLKKQALYDSVTGLPNRALVLDRLSHAMKRATRSNQKVALIFIDLDDFKKVNDTLGHSVGDELLIMSAQRLQAAVRPSDTVSRLGGDEFVVIITSLSDSNNTHSIVEQLLAQFRVPFNIEGRNVVTTASIGISIYPDNGDSESSLLRKADAAMYHSKACGRDMYSYYTDKMNDQVSRRLLLEEQMHLGLSNNEFSVLYQPKIQLPSYKITSVEALIRWDNQILGSITPTEFIPIAEQTGLISELGHFVLEQSLNNLTKWQALDNQFSVSVNISPRQFRDADLPEKIKKLIDQYQTPSKSLELEITEGVLISGHKQAEETLKKILELGVHISMDDFGTGYSSLSYIRQYPFDVIKIDQSFIHDIEQDPKDCALIKATISMAHAMELKVVAEGVETAAQLAFLEENNCDHIQGFYFSQPITAREIEELLNSKSMKQLCNSTETSKTLTIDEP